MDPLGAKRRLATALLCAALAQAGQAPAYEEPPAEDEARTTPEFRPTPAR